MTKSEIISQLVAKGYNNDASATQQDLYTTITRKQLFSNSNRLNAGWARGKYLIASLDETNHPEAEYVSQWLSKVAKYQNQFLCLEVASNEWHFYDSFGESIPFNVLPPQLNPTVAQEDSASDDDNEENPGNINYLTALRTKPFMLLAGISGTGKSRIVRKLAQASVTKELQEKYDPQSVKTGFNRWELHKPANFEIIQVKPNWHNSLDVIGYKSNIGGAHYEFTPFVEFVARAWRHLDIPFFLCLDEMNLAPVEQYFAEFLSAIESRSIENGEYETDPIVKPFSDFGEDVCNKMIDHLVGKVDASNVVPESPIAKLVDRFKTKGLTLPKNLLVMGTVNMDETTFSFSRKVLDRAMSVVMNEVDYENFFKGESVNDVSEMSSKTLNALINRPINGLSSSNNDNESVKKYLTGINVILDDTPFKLGYRAANEALLYVSAAHHFNPEASTNTALDEFTMMKILSRIEGDKRSVGSLLSDLQTVITPDYPLSHAKLVKMSNTLISKQFVSYWT